jgi:hypothetical protein
MCIGTHKTYLQDIGIHNIGIGIHKTIIKQKHSTYRIINKNNGWIHSTYSKLVSVISQGIFHPKQTLQPHHLHHGTKQ